MTLVVHYDPEIQVVVSTSSGIITPSELRAETIQVAALAEANNCTRVLSDFARATVNFSFFDVFSLPELQDEAGLPRSSRVAVVAPNSAVGMDLADFYETVTLNRGWISKVFYDRQAALDWLLA